MHGNTSSHVRLLQKEWPEQTHKRQILVHGIFLVIFSLLYFYCDKWVCVLNIRHLLGSHCVLCAILEAMRTIDQKKLSLHLWQFFGVCSEKSMQSTTLSLCEDQTVRLEGSRGAGLGWAGLGRAGLWRSKQYRQSACELYLVPLFF